MKITDIRTDEITVPLIKPFKTALRTANSIKSVLVIVETDSGEVGYGEAPPTGVITGDTIGSIKGAINEHIKKTLIGKEIENFEDLMIKLDTSVLNNNSAKAAVEIALFDLYGKLYKAPIYKLLGGFRTELTTDITISVNDPEEMAKDSIDAIKSGYKILKIKVGKDIKLDLKRMKAIREVVGDEVKLRLDANQGWNYKEAIQAINKMENDGFNIEFIEQPVKAKDFEGLKRVTDNVGVPIMADESVFSPVDAIEIIKNKAADLVNIKLMKTAGIRNALKICAIAEIYEVECMIGSMLETKLSVTAAAHLAGAKSIITKFDLDTPLLCSEDPINGGIHYEGPKITLNNNYGFGISGIKSISSI
ncbi:L-Ala-D/L-Glu epimerase [Clostridium aceticum]|uniref:Dipeptide epimerase n=1 Tax=Clostridium aceticum TaxID=84022 RepID=A0A0D8IAS1_9CLOT|nr:dipeptide epimerase [Clostridium aceticum]AKL96480.1 L-Ala-D/L-Glu epimerase [Clostridium aceticum]KJF27348.1 L-alanine-DL-glutamate epimerase [Clostridium aceticum]